TCARAEAGRRSEDTAEVRAEAAEDTWVLWMLGVTRRHSRGPGSRSAPRPTPVLARIERSAFSVLVFAGAMFLVIAYTPLVNLLAMPLWSVPQDPARAEVAVVLSGGRRDDGTLSEDAVATTNSAAGLSPHGPGP